MKSKTMLLSGLLVLIGGLLNAPPGLAQSQSQPGSPNLRPRILINLYNPLGQPATQYQDRYRYVLPPTSRHGAYYMYENGHYYTPLALRVDGQPSVVRRPVVMKFGAARHLVELSERLETLANEMCLDMHYNYQNNRGFNETYREAYQFLQATKFIHDSEHHGDREAIRRSAENIDQLFHHVQGDVRKWNRQERRPVGHLGLHAKMEELQALLHHLLFDLGVKPEHDDDHRDNQAPPPARGREEAPPPPGAPKPRR